MAGIGFELRKMFKNGSITSKIKGTVYATFTTIGPTIIFLLMLLGINFAVRVLEVSEKDRMFFSSASTYGFIFAILISGSLNTILSRYVSDMLFKKNNEKIPPALFGSMFISAIIAGIFSLILCVVLYFKYDTDLYFLCGYYLFSVMISVTYTIMTLVSAIKEYKKITMAFFVGILTGVLTFLLLYYVIGITVLNSLIYSMTVAFLIINIIIAYFILSFFDYSGNDYFEFLAYFKKYPLLALSGIFYITGLYAANIIYWFFSDISMKVAVFRVAPSYDMAAFLAMIINLSAPVIFCVNVETQLFEKYKQYTAALTGANYSTIEKTRKLMCNIINVQLFFIYEVQLIITIILTCLAILLFPMFGFGGLVLDFFLLLGLAMFCIFSMYFTVVMLYYFDDQVGSCTAAGIFFAVTVLASIIAVRLGPGYYAMPSLLGGLAGLIYAFMRLRHFLKTINARLFCY